MAGVVRAPEPSITEPRRLSRGDRRDALLDAAARLLADHGANAITMDAVASEAGVSRPLLYKHFANRDELVAALVRREVDSLDTEVNDAIEGLVGLEAIVRASADAIVEGVVRRGRIVAELLRAALADEELRREQQARRRRTRQWYVDLVMQEYDLDKTDAEAAVAMYFTGLDSMFSSWRSNPTRKEREHLIDVFVCLVTGGLEALAKR